MEKRKGKNVSQMEGESGGRARRWSSTTLKRPAKRADRRMVIKGQGKLPREGRDLKNRRIEVALGRSGKPKSQSRLTSADGDGNARSSRSIELHAERGRWRVDLREKNVEVCSGTAFETGPTPWSLILARGVNHPPKRQQIVDQM